MTPTLAVVLVGENPASQTYVASKGKACIEAGMGSITHRLDASVSQQEVEDLVRALNADPSVNGILVQLPLPRGMDEKKVLDLISIEKDVDGFHPMNIGELVMKGRTPKFVPCTPAGCIEMLKRSGIPIAGRGCGGRGPLEHRRRAGRSAAAKRRRDGHRLPQPDEGSRPPRCARPTSSLRRSASPIT